jgi:hypothetical protein
MSGWIVAFVIVALILAASAVRSRSRFGAISCSTCGGPTRRQGDYLMCDECQRFVGLYSHGTKS